MNFGTKLPRWFRLALLLPAAFLLSGAAATRPAVVERLYSRGLYPPIGQGLAVLFGRLPFSAAEIFLAAAIFLLLYRLGKALTARNRGPQVWVSTLLRSVPWLLAGAGILTASFIVLWGLNYHRLPFAVLAGYDTTPAPVEELALLVEDLTERAQGLREGLPEDASGALSIPGGVASVLSRAGAGYRAAARLYPTLAGQYGAPKGAFFSRVLSWAGIYGIYSPFTGEAHVNRGIPASQLPSTACHEMAHQRGYAREDEANYLAYITCILHPDPDFRYSGVLLALLNAADALHARDPARYQALRAQYGTAIERDLAAIRIYQGRYSGPVSQLSDRVNDTYLRANNQGDGIESYGRMVDLLIAERRAKMTE